MSRRPDVFAGRPLSARSIVCQQLPGLPLGAQPNLAGAGHQRGGVMTPFPPTIPPSTE